MPSDTMTEAERHRQLREAKKAMKAAYGRECPHCVAMPKGPPPRVLLPGELCKAHNYRDRRPRTEDNSYLIEGAGHGAE